MRARCFVLVIVVSAASVGIIGCGHGSPTEPTPVCSYAISSASAAFASDGGTGSVAVAVAAGCAWTAAVTGSWITITSGSSGSGPGTVAYSVAPNPATEPRSGSLAMGGQTHAIAQQGRPAAPCIYELSPGSAEFGKDAATGTFSISAPNDCPWTSASSASWLLVSSGNQGSGNGSVLYTVARNLDVVDRAATITVADKAFTVRQAGDIGGCQVLSSARRSQLVHARRQCHGECHDTGGLFMDGRAERVMAHGAERVIRYGVRRHHDRILRELRRAAGRHRDGALANANGRTEHPAGASGVPVCGQPKLLQRYRGRNVRHL